MVFDDIDTKNLELGPDDFRSLGWTVDKYNKSSKKRFFIKPRTNKTRADYVELVIGLKTLKIKFYRASSFNDFYTDTLPRFSDLYLSPQLLITTTNIKNLVEKIENEYEINILNFDFR